MWLTSVVAYDVVIYVSYSCWSILRQSCFIVKLEKPLGWWFTPEPSADINILPPVVMWDNSWMHVWRHKPERFTEMVNSQTCLFGCYVDCDEYLPLCSSQWIEFICSIQYYLYILYAVCITGVAFGRNALRIQIFMTTEGCPRKAHLLEANGIWMAY